MSNPSKIRCVNWLRLPILLLLVGALFASCRTNIDDGIVNVTGITVEESSIRLLLGEKAVIVPNVQPDNATNQTVEWEVDDPSIATIDDGVVTASAKKTGTAHVTVRTNDGGYEAVIEVIVYSNERPLVGLALSDSVLDLYHKHTAKINVLADAEAEITLEQVSSNAVTAEYDATNKQLIINGDNIGSAEITLKAHREGMFTDNTAKIKVNVNEWHLAIEGLPEKLVIDTKTTPATASFKLIVNTDEATKEVKITEGTGFTLTNNGDTYTVTATSAGTGKLHVKASYSDETIEKDIILEAKSVTIKSKTFTVNTKSFKMIYVEPGKFWMGSPEGSFGHYPDETYHEVEITKGFWIMETIMTNNIVYAINGSTIVEHWEGTRDSFSANDNPCTFLAWEDVKKLATTITGKNLTDDEGKSLTFDMPTEAQWEYAARGGHLYSGYQLYAGSDNVRDVAVHEDDAQGPIFNAATVKTKKANQLGIYDMCGNVWEWCKDYYDPDYYKNSSRDPYQSTIKVNCDEGLGKGTRPMVVARGGYYALQPQNCRAAQRYYHHSGWWGCTGGRLVAYVK